MNKVAPFARSERYDRIVPIREGYSSDQKYRVVKNKKCFLLITFAADGLLAKKKI